MSSLKRRVPPSVKELGRRAQAPVGRATASARMMPSFIVAGAQRCGTTSLYRALLSHPAILSPVYHKGVNYFDVNYQRGPDWYRSHFPLRASAALRARRAADAAITFDASGYYMFHPLAAERIGRDLPGVRVIVMLRDPVERAYSAYRHELARGFETESFERALELEDDRVEPELAAMLADPTYQSFEYRHQAYRRRGQYAEQVQRLADAVGREQVLVVESQDFFTTPETEYRRITDFLGLHPHQPRTFERWNARPGSAMSDEAAGFLRSAFATHDQALAELLGHPPSWLR